MGRQTWNGTRLQFRYRKFDICVVHKAQVVYPIGLSPLWDGDCWLRNGLMVLSVQRGMDALKVSLTSEIWPEFPVSPGTCWWFQITMPLLEILVLDPRWIWMPIYHLRSVNIMKTANLLHGMPNWFPSLLSKGDYEIITICDHCGFFIRYNSSLIFQNPNFPYFSQRCCAVFPV